jgi:O-antigen/teichoic acid export membrane protein
VFVLWAVAPKVELFFLCQAIISLIQLALMRGALWRSMPRLAERAQFRMETLRRVWKYALGMLGMSVTASILLQVDKLTLSRILSLRSLSYYLLAWSFAQVPISLLSSPFQQACFPRLTQLGGAGAETEFARFYHRASQALSCLLAPTSAVMFFQAGPLIRVWLRAPAVAENVYPLAAVLVLPMTLQGLLVLPYAAQLAQAWTRLALCTNAISVAIIVPLTILLARRYQAYGACAAWIILETIYVIAILAIMHRRVLKGEAWRWLFGDILKPFSAAWLFAGTTIWILSHSIVSVPAIAVSAGAGLIALTAAAMSAPHVRREILARAPYARRVGFARETGL